ncbi:MAG TPA: FadR/GntR family transcriptional regulator [Burkholderiaceae bacterium]|nr:FadR/GntR family transcriptional regulator [Burkholderiaceae bacterium]
MKIQAAVPTSAMERHSADDDFERIRPPRAFEEITAQLRQRVIHGRLKPGDRLPAERELAAKLGVSRNSVREALRVLETAGVLRLQKGAHGGAFVASPNGQSVATALQDMFQLGSVTPAQLTEARLHITDSVVRLACGRITPEQLAALERNVERSRAASDAGDYPERSRINLEFHKILAQATGNPVFESVMSGLVAIMQHFVDTLGPPHGDAVFESRGRFIARLRAGDAQAAIDEMTGFLRSVHEQYLSALESRAGEPAPAAAAPRGGRRKAAAVRR